MHGNSITSFENNEAKRWLIIGAHQAGATDKAIARMCGINQPSVRRIILNFQKTGSPSIPRKLTAREKAKPFVEYDENGNLIDSEDESPNEPVAPQKSSAFKEKIRARRPSAKDLIAYVLNKAQQSERKEAALFVKREEDVDKDVLKLLDKWRPPTPPRDPSNQNQLNEQQYRHEQRELIHSPPLSESSSGSSISSVSPKPRYEIIKGYETWTIEDDKILMAHVLTRLSGCRWKEAELKLRGKHTAEGCEKRWQKLRDLIIHGVSKSGTRGW